MKFHGILRVKFKIMGSQTIFCSWYFHACGRHNVACYHFIVSSQSYCLLQNCLHDHDLQCSCPLSWKDCYSKMSILREWPNFIIKQLSGNVLQMWIMEKSISMDFDQALVNFFLQLDHIVLISHLWALLIWKLEKSFDGFLLERSSHISPCNFNDQILYYENGWGITCWKKIA